ncbi:MAG: FtsX-like permease family protein [Firmicutes bacterium]|nr:FtsX-like permease family protein [Bacillota bacterium]
MFKNYLYLIPRYMMSNKKRTFVTAISIVLSIALLASVGVIINGHTNRMINNAEELSGKYHGKYRNIEVDLLYKLKESSLLSKVGTTLDLGDSEKDEYTISITGSDKVAAGLNNIKVMEGKFPEDKNEIAIEEWIYNKFYDDIEIGDKIKIKYTNTTHMGEIIEREVETEFILCGILENSFNSRASKQGKAYVTIETANNIIPKYERTYEQYFRVKESLPLKSSLQSIKSLKEEKKENENYLGEYEENTRLLNSLDSAKKSKRLILGIDMIIALAVIMMIYNIFNISSVERLRHFGLLRSIGLTPKQLKKILIGEAILFALIFVPIGVIVGGLGTKLILKIISDISGMEISGHLTLFNTILSIVVGFFSIIIASLSPARISSKISPIESLNIEGNILEDNRKGNKRTNKNKIIHRLFGYTGKIAFTNLVRNKKRFYATVISISISIALFITANYFVKNLNPYYQASQSMDSDYVLSLQKNNEPIGYSEGVVNEIENLAGVESVRKMKFNFSTLKLKEYQLTKKGIEENQNDKEYGNFEEEWPYQINIIAVGLTQEILKENGIYESETNKDDKLPDVYIMQNLNYQNTTKVKIGNEIRIELSYKGNPDWIHKKSTFRVAKILEESPITFNTWDGDAAIYMDEKDMEKYFGSEGYQKIEINVTKDANTQSIEAKLNEIVKNQENGELTIFRDQVEKINQLRIQIASILYILIGVIILVGLINIINIMNTNVILRRREFGMLRALGMTNNQLRKVITKEGLFYGLLSSIIGSIISVMLVCLVYYFARKGMNLELEISYASMILACVVTTTLTVISTLIPLKKAISLNVVESIRAID